MARVVGLDPGTRRVGVAVSDPGGLIAQPHSTIAAEPADTLAARLAAVIEEIGATRVVVGLPRRLDGTVGPEAKEARRLATELRRLTRRPVSLLDERLTSVAADRALREGGRRRAERRQLADQVAAALILQTYLDSRAGGGGPDE
jgi:putative Holliday junction resolvase